MDPFTIAGIAAMIAGAGLQYKSSTDAARRAREATNRSLENQRRLQMEAERTALENAENFRDEPRKERQLELEQQLEEEFAAPAIGAQQINQEGAQVQGNVSDDYLASKAASDANQMKLAREFAKMFSQTRAANKLRMNEAFDTANAAANIGRLQSFSRGQQQADDIAIREAAQPSAGLNLAGSLIGALGSAGVMNGLTSGNAGTVVAHPAASLADKPLSSRNWLLSGTPSNPFNFG